MGAWIEIPILNSVPQDKYVAPTKGAWIEIPFDAYITNLGKSRPTRARRLKFVKCTQLTEMV